MARWAPEGTDNSTGSGSPDGLISTGSRLPNTTAGWAPDGPDGLVLGWARWALDCPTARWARDGPDVQRFDGLVTARRSEGLTGSGQLDGLNGLDSTGALNLTGLTQQVQVNGLDSTRRARVNGLDGRAQLNRMIGLPHRLLGTFKPRGALPSSSPLLPDTTAVAAAQDRSSAFFAQWSLGARSPSLPLTDNDMVWHVPRELVATRLGRDGCILRRTTRMSQVKTCPEARPTRTDSHAARKGELTFRRIALSPARSCLEGGGGKPQL
jgi:hypothetical protein